MKIKGHDVFLADNGTLDTVITVDGHEIVYDCDFSGQYRDIHGDFTRKEFRALGEIAVDDYERNG
jgi:hypothetical protein